MAEKIKITKAEIAELYDITDDESITPVDIAIEQRDQANATFEEFTQSYDEKERKEMREKENA